MVLVTQDTTLPPLKRYIGQPEHKIKEPLLWDRIKSPEGLSALELEVGGVDRLLFVIDKEGNMYTFYPSGNRRGFSGLAYGFNTPNITQTDAAIFDITRDLQNHPNYSDPLAVVFSDYEAQFREVARRVGLQPSRIRDEPF